MFYAIFFINTAIFIKRTILPPVMDRILNNIVRVPNACNSQLEELSLYLVNVCIRTYSNILKRE